MQLPIDQIGCLEDLYMHTCAVCEQNGTGAYKIWELCLICIYHL